MLLSLVLACFFNPATLNGPVLLKKIHLVVGTSKKLRKEKALYIHIFGTKGMKVLTPPWCLQTPMSAWLPVISLVCPMISGCGQIVSHL